jgi:hypothetical protein
VYTVLAVTDPLDGFCDEEVKPDGDDVHAKVAAGAGEYVPVTDTLLMAQYQSNEAVYLNRM